MAQTVAAAQHTPAMRATTLIVENMRCGGCMQKVETTLSGLPGVISARANLSAKRVTVTTTLPGSEPLVDALDKAGFKSAELRQTADRDQGTSQGTSDRTFLRRIGVAGFAAANIMLLSVSVWSGQSGEMDQSIVSLFHWISALIALPAVAYAGQPFFASAVGALRAGRLNMDVPISLGVLLATGMSLFQTLRGGHQVYFDAAVTLLLFLLIGRFLDDRMRSRAAGAAANMLALRALSATVVQADGGTVRLPIASVAPGMRILVAAGERIAADGRIVTGESCIDESLITGESAPRTIRRGETVHAGTINLTAPVVVEVRAVDEDTLLAEIGRLMEAAEQARGRYVRLADRAVRYYAPAVHILGLITFGGWMLAGQGWEPALTAAIAVLIITCPCALALAVPAVQVAAASRLFARGIILKSPDGLERLAETDTVVFDKTGTLSCSEPHLIQSQPADPDALGWAAALAVASRHPYARAIVGAAHAQGLEPLAAADVVEHPGLGLSRSTPAGEERLGSAQWCGIKDRSDDAATLWYKPASGEPTAWHFEERMRPDAKAVVKALAIAGYAIELLSGDRAAAVERATIATGIVHALSRQSPADKLARLEALKAEGRTVAMVGDGLNDAPALAAAHASISPSSAADISQTAADAVFQGDSLAPVFETLMVARAARRLALQNFAIAVGYNALFVPLAMAGLVTPLIAAVAMSTSSIAVTVNALRLKSHRLELPS